MSLGKEAQESDEKGREAEILRRAQKAEQLLNQKSDQNNAIINKNNAMAGYFAQLSIKQHNDGLGIIQFALDSAIGALKENSNHNDGSDINEGDKRLLRGLQADLSSTVQDVKNRLQILSSALKFVDKENYGEYLLNYLRNRNLIAE